MYSARITNIFNAQNVVDNDSVAIRTERTIFPQMYYKDRNFRIDVCLSDSFLLFQNRCNRIPPTSMNAGTKCNQNIVHSGIRNAGTLYSPSGFYLPYP